MKHVRNSDSKINSLEIRTAIVPHIRTIFGYPLKWNILGAIKYFCSFFGGYGAYNFSHKKIRNCKNLGNNKSKGTCKPIKKFD